MSEGTWTDDTSRASSEDVPGEDERQRVWYYTERVCVYTEGLGEERVLQFQTADVKEKGSGQPLEGTFLVLLINYLRAYTAPCNQIYIIACKTFLLACVYMCVCMCGATCEVAVKRFHEKVVGDTENLIE